MLTAKDKFEDKQDNVQRLKQALDINKPLATVYYMKEDLRQIWNWTNDKKRFPGISATFEFFSLWRRKSTQGAE